MFIFTINDLLQKFILKYNIVKYTVYKCLLNYVTDLIITIIFKRIINYIYSTLLTVSCETTIIG